MMLKTLVTVLLSVMITAPGFADDEVQVDITKRIEQGLCDGSTRTQYFDSGEAINLTVSYCDRFIAIWVPDYPFTYDIGHVTINGAGGSDLYVFIGSGSFPFGGGNMTEAARDFGGLTIDDASLRDRTGFAGRIERDLTGSIHVGQLYRFDVDGQVKSQIRATERGGSFFDIRMGSSTSGGVGAVRYRSDTSSSIRRKCLWPDRSDRRQHIVD